jgi:hypothetical protein
MFRCSIITRGGGIKNKEVNIMSEKLTMSLPEFTKKLGISRSLASPKSPLKAKPRRRGRVELTG